MSTTTVIPAHLQTSTGSRDTSKQLLRDDELKAVAFLAAAVTVANPSAEDNIRIHECLALVKVSREQWEGHRASAKQRLGGAVVIRRDPEDVVRAVARHRRELTEYLALLTRECEGGKVDAKAVAKLAASIGFSDSQVNKHRGELTRWHGYKAVDIPSLEREKRAAEKRLADFEAEMEAVKHRRLRDAVSACNDRLNDAGGAAGRMVRIEEGPLREIFEFLKSDYTTVTSTAKESAA